MSPEYKNYEVYEKHGIKFMYPDDWEIEESENEDGQCVVLDSPLTVSLTITILPSRPDPAHIIEQIVDVFSSEYPEIDIYDPQESTLGEYSVYMQELEFVCHELINIAKITALKTYQFSLLIMSQGYDQDMEEFRSVLEHIFQSLELTDDDERIIV